VATARNPSGPAPLVSVVVPNYNGARFLPRCLDALSAQVYPSREVIVVDDASTDEGPDLVRRGHPQFTLLALEQNRGFCGACNAGVAAARGEYVALVNNDALLPPYALASMVACLQANPKAWVAAPHIHNLNLDMRSYPRPGTLGLTGLIIQNVFAGPDQVFGAPGAALLFRREAGLPFDADYRFFHEDVYFSWRTWLSGHEVAACPEVRVEHLGSATLGPRHEQNRWWLERNRWLNLLRFYSPGTWLRAWPLFLLALPAEWLADVLSGRSLGPRCRAYAWLLSHPGLIWRKRRATQALRRVPDAVILRRFSCRLTNSDQGPGRWLNRLARLWCRLVRLQTYELGT